MNVSGLIVSVCLKQQHTADIVRPSVCLILMRQRRVSIMAGKSRPAASVRLAVLSDM